MLHKNIIKLAALLWCVLTVASCTNEDFDKGNNGPDVPEGLPVTLKLNIGTIIRKTTRTNFQNEAVRYFYSLPKRSGSFWYKLQWH